MEFCNIICTQPRRIAAISIAKRVCQERKWNLGEVVSYQVGFLGNNQANGGGWTEGVSISFLSIMKVSKLAEISIIGQTLAFRMNNCR